MSKQELLSFNDKVSLASILGFFTIAVLLIIQKTYFPTPEDDCAELFKLVREEDDIVNNMLSKMAYKTRGITGLIYKDLGDYCQAEGSLPLFSKPPISNDLVEVIPSKNWPNTFFFRIKKP
jgi:hypothetical protein